MICIYKQEVYSDKYALAKGSLKMLSSLPSTVDFLSETQGAFTIESPKFYFVLQVLVAISSIIYPSNDSLDWLEFKSGQAIMHIANNYQKLSQMIGFSTYNPHYQDAITRKKLLKEYKDFIESVKSTLVKLNDKICSKDVTLSEIYTLKNLVMIITDLSLALSLQDKVSIVTKDIVSLEDEYAAVKAKLTNLLVLTGEKLSKSSIDIKW